MIIRGARIRAIAAAVPSEKRGQDYWPDGPKLAKFTGIQERRIAREGVLPSDMNRVAAETLLATYPRESIDCLIHITQSPDYTAPATSCILHESLGLRRDCSVFDAVQGCSAYVYGLWLASCILSAGGAKRVLLLVGDINAVPLDQIAPEDKATEPLFGDAGSATILDADPAAPPMVYINGTDGTGWRFLVVPGSGRRCVGAPWKIQMDGAEVFSFTLREIPPLAHAVLAEAQWSIDDCDAVVLHQANKVILDAARTKIGVPPEKFVYGLQNFGNTGGPSVALALVTEQVKPGKWLLLGFGVGMSWSGLAVDAQGVEVFPLVEMP